HWQRQGAGRGPKIGPRFLSCLSKVGKPYWARAKRRMVHMATMDVLLVEDDPRIARVVERALTDVGHRVEVARDGLEGLTSAERGSHDLLVLDVMLPEMDGLQVAR